MKAISWLYLKVRFSENDGGLPILFETIDFQEIFCVH